MKDNWDSTRRTWTCWRGSRGGHKDDPRAGAPLLLGKAERVGLFSLEKRRLRGDLRAAFQYLKGPTRKMWKIFSAGLVAIEQGGFKLREGRFRWDIRKKFFTMRLVKQVVQRGSGGPIPGKIQGQVGRGSEQPDPIEDVPAYCGEGWAR